MGDSLSHLDDLLYANQSRFHETGRAWWSRLIFSMRAWLSNRANWVWKRVAFAELCQDFIPIGMKSLSILFIGFESPGNLTRSSCSA